MPETSEELVFCLCSNALARLFAERTGNPAAVWLPAEAAPLEEWLPGIRKAFLPRSEAEIQPEWRHLATYATLTCGDKVFTYRRGKSGSERRLHGRLSVGVGGHVTIEDYADEANGEGILGMPFVAAMRELDEELDFECGRRWGLAGFITSDASIVDRVHMGVVSHVSIEEGREHRVHVHEDCLADPKWMTHAELAEHFADLESWSQIVAREVLGIHGGEGE